MELLLAREFNGVWTRVGAKGVALTPVPGEGGTWEGWEPFVAPEGEEFTEGDRLYPATWWPENGRVLDPPTPAYVWEVGKWNNRSNYSDPWEMIIVGGHGLPDNPVSPPLLEALDHVGWSDTVGWGTAVMTAVRLNNAVVVDWGDSLTVWTRRSVHRPRGTRVRPGECGADVYEALRAGAQEVQVLRSGRAAAVREAARLCGAAADPETARMVRMAYAPSTRENWGGGDEAADELMVQAARSAMQGLAGRCGDRWMTWRGSRIDGDPKSWTIEDCGQAAVGKVSSWAAKRPREIARSRFPHGWGALGEILADPGDVAITPSGIRTDRTPCLSEAVASVIEKWGDREVQRWWDARDIAPWGFPVASGRVMHALEDPFESDNPRNSADADEPRATAEYIVCQAVRHLADLLGLREECEEELM